MSLNIYHVSQSTVHILAIPFFVKTLDYVVLIKDETVLIYLHVSRATIVSQSNYCPFENVVNLMPTGKPGEFCEFISYHIFV